MSGSPVLLAAQAVEGTEDGLDDAMVDAAPRYLIGLGLVIGAWLVAKLVTRLTLPEPRRAVLDRALTGGGSTGSGRPPDRCRAEGGRDLDGRSETNGAR